VDWVTIDRLVPCIFGYFLMAPPPLLVVDTPCRCCVWSLFNKREVILNGLGCRPKAMAAFTYKKKMIAMASDRPADH
jgi:hypothetical protein